MPLQLIQTDESLYAATFRELIEDRAGTEPSWLQLFRKNAFDRFQRRGFPTTREEDWKYTNVTAIGKARFLPAGSQSENRIEADELSSLTYEEARQNTFVFVNGRFRQELSSRDTGDVVFMKLADAVAGTPYGDMVRHHYERSAADEHGFISLNTAFADGVLLVIPANKKIDRPLHLLFAAKNGQGQPAATFPRVMVVAEENSSAILLETYAGINRGSYLTNGIIDFVLAQGSNLKHYKIQRENTESFHLAATRVDLGPNANYDATTINLGAAISRHGIDVKMDHEGAQCRVDGLYMVEGKQHTDTHSTIDHRQPHCSSQQLYKGILDGQSRAVFNGKVFVRHGAQQTIARQTNKNLLLSKEARVDTKPQLEIFADDVKCAHGAAVGQLEPDEIFYLESRGIRPQLARNLLTFGFAEEVIEKINIDSIRHELNNAVLNRLQTTL